MYLAEELAELPVGRLHRKEESFQQVRQNFSFEYKPLGPELIRRVLDMQETWCRLRECQEDPGLASEDRAYLHALTHYEHLDYAGGGDPIEGQVEAFRLGEPLSPDTAVIHIEKGNPPLTASTRP